MTSWRKKIRPEVVPDSYQGFRNALYSQRYRVVRVHQQGVLEVAVETLNEESVAIVFYNSDVIRDFGIICSEIHVITTTRVLPNNMESTCQLLIVVAVFKNYVSIFAITYILSESCVCVKKSRPYFSWSCRGLVTFFFVMVEVLLLFYYEIFFGFNVEGIAQKYRSFDIPFGIEFDQNRLKRSNFSSLLEAIILPTFY